MEIYKHPTFEMACRQFDVVADRLGISENDRDRLESPKRSMTVAVPIERQITRDTAVLSLTVCACTVPSPA